MDTVCVELRVAARSKYAKAYLNIGYIFSVTLGMYAIIVAKTYGGRIPCEF